MKRFLWFAFTITFTLSVLLAGCGGAGNGAGGDKAGQPSNAQETVEQGGSSNSDSSEGKSIWDD